MFLLILRSSKKENLHKFTWEQWKINSKPGKNTKLIKLFQDIFDSLTKNQNFLESSKTIQTAQKLTYFVLLVCGTYLVLTQYTNIQLKLLGKRAKLVVAQKF